MAQSIVDSMRYLAKQGKTVISTIHQPSSQIFEKFDMYAIYYILIDFIISELDVKQNTLDSSSSDYNLIKKLYCIYLSIIF